MKSDGWPLALLIFGASCLFWVVAVQTTLGRALLDALLGINSIGI